LEIYAHKQFLTVVFESFGHKKSGVLNTGFFMAEEHGPNYFRAVT